MTRVNEILQLDPVLDAARNGSRDALAELYRAHADAVIALAYRVTGSREDAEDVLQDVFVGLPRALRSYDERGSFQAWLKRITARTALMKLRSMERKRESPLDAVANEPPVNGAELGAVAAMRVIDRLTMTRALARLPQTLCAVFLLKEVEGYSHDEIASLLGITAGASATRLSRAWSVLRKELAT